MPLTRNDLFAHELRGLIEGEIGRLTVNVIGGGGVEDFSAYRHITGQIAGLRKALDLFDEAAKLTAEKS